MHQRRTYLPSTEFALQALGAQIAAARRTVGWTATELAARLGVTPRVVSNIERGSTSTAIGTVLEAAVLCGVPLFEVDAAELRDVAAREQMRLALLPSRVRRRPLELRDDF